MKYLDKYHDQYVQIGILLLADALNIFPNTCIEIYEFDPAHLLSATGLAL